MEVIIVDFHRPRPSEVASFGSMDSVSETIVEVVMAKHQFASLSSIHCRPRKGSRDLDVIILYKKEIRLSPICRTSPRSIALWITAVGCLERLKIGRAHV